MNQPDNTILNELNELSPALAAIPRLNVFTVPQGYFDSFPALALLQTKDLKKDNKNASVPEGYFDNLASSIMARIKNEALVEDNDTSLLSGIGNNNIYTVPEGYFESFASILVGRIKNGSLTEMEDTSVLEGIGNKNVFTVPEGYFEGLASGIINRITTLESNTVFEETNLLSATVAGIGNKNVFRVPEGYFESLSGSIIKTSGQPAKVVQMNSFRKFARYAAAAVVTGLITTSTIFIINKNDNSGVVATANDAAMKTAESIIKTNSFDKEMASLSDADIVNFLESKGQDVDAALVASLTEDEKSLPEADDYLINEHALDDILKDLDLNN